MYQIDSTSSVPLHTQLEEQIHLAIHSGQLQPGDRLPSVRAMARQLHLNPNTVARVYRDLKAKGYLCAARGAGTTVSFDLPEKLLDLSQVRPQAQVLIDQCRQIGMSRDEFMQLATELWKESKYER